MFACLLFVIVIVLPGSYLPGFNFKIYNVNLIWVLIWVDCGFCGVLLFNCLFWVFIVIISWMFVLLCFCWLYLVVFGLLGGVSVIVFVVYMYLMRLWFRGSVDFGFV